VPDANQEPSHLVDVTADLAFTRGRIAHALTRIASALEDSTAVKYRRRKQSQPQPRGAVVLASTTPPIGPLT
jgi:hypothetical protein